MKKTNITKTAVAAGIMFMAVTFSVSAKPNQPPVSKTTTVVTTTTTTTTTTAPVPSKNVPATASKKPVSPKPHDHPAVHHHHKPNHPYHVDNHKKGPAKSDPRLKAAPKHCEPPRHPEPQKQEVIIIKPDSKTSQKAATVAVVAAGVATVASIAALLAD